MIFIGQWAPTSQTCSTCGAVKAKLTLPKRTFECRVCSFVLDRDINAARNIAALAGVAPSTEETQNARGAASGKPVPNTVERRVAMNREVPLGSSPPSNERTFHKVFCASAKSLARGKRGTPPCSLRTLSPPCPLARGVVSHPGSAWNGSDPADSGPSLAPP